MWHKAGLWLGDARARRDMSVVTEMSFSSPGEAVNSTVVHWLPFSHRIVDDVTAPARLLAGSARVVSAADAIARMSLRGPMSASAGSSR